MKKWIALILSFVFLLSLLGCQDVENSAKLKVYTTNFTPYDFVRQIGGERVDVQMLISPGSESHYYEATLAELAAVSRADLFLFVGGESDEWIKKSADVLNSGDLVQLPLIDCVPTLNEEIAEGMEHEEEEGKDAVPDEHIWTSPKNAKLIADAVCDALCRLDPENETYFRDNNAVLQRKLDDLDARLRRIVREGKRKTVVFAERFPFLYLAREYGLEYYAAFAGCSTQSEPSLATVRFLIEKIEEENIPVVFTIEFSNGKTADTVCASTGCKKLLLHSCHNVTKSDFDRGVTYLELMEKNADHLAEALGE